MKRWSGARVTIVAFALLGCSSGSALVPCSADSGGAPCPSGTECLWLRTGGYFCFARCTSNSDTCSDGRTCHAAGASSCAICDDLLDVCE